MERKGSPVKNYIKKTTTTNDVIIHKQIITEIIKRTNRNKIKAEDRHNTGLERQGPDREEEGAAHPPGLARD